LQRRQTQYEPKSDEDFRLVEEFNKKEKEYEKQIKDLIVKKHQAQEECMKK